MKTAKETIYEYIQQQIYSHNNQDGLETKAIAQQLGILRSNVSAILNELVKEKKLTKTNTRPVYYKLAGQTSSSSGDSCFTELIGYNSSLRNAIQLAKAAILYPNKSLNVLLSSHNGCGTTRFAYAMYDFAKERQIINQDAPWIKINCRHYSKNISVLDDEFFGIAGELQKSCFARAQGGVLFLDNVDLLDAKQQSCLFTFLESGHIYSADKSQSLDCQNLFLILSCSSSSGLQLNRIMPVTISLPELKDRPIKERFELINHFFSIEASHSGRSIEVTIESMKALLITDFTIYNIKELKFEIKVACANAYVRVVNELDQDIYVCINDFNSEIKKNLLQLKNFFTELESILGTRETIFYDKNTGYLDIQLPNKDIDVYYEIKKQYDELNNLGINDTGINNVINTHIQNLFREYRYAKRADNSNNLEQLSKIVDQKVINLVNQFIQSSKKELGRNLKSNVFYGLCLHINSLLTLNFNQQRMNNDQIVQVIQNYPQEYAAAVQFSTVLKKQLQLELPIHEIVLIAMFLIENDEDKADYPVLLYIMHGNQTASSLKDVTNSLTHCHNAYSYDLTLDTEIPQAMEEIKELILKINSGQGVIVIYDMGSIKIMLETISEEIDVKMRYINMPITLIGIDIARRCSMETDIDYVYHMANLEINKMKDREEKYNQVIVTLCHTGEGGAIQLKRYIDQYSKLNMKTIALSISSRDNLLREIMALKKTYHIHCLVGTYDPKLLGIPFVSIGKIFENSQDNLDRILMFEPVSSRFFDYNEVYDYLSESFKYVSINKLKSVLPGIIDEFSIMYSLNEDQRVGLFMHLACLVERLLDGKTATINEDKNKLISVFDEDYHVIRKTLQELEKLFKIIIDDNEIATIIMVVKQI